MLHWFGKKLREMQEVKRDERGFTLIELLVVIIIIGILAAIAIPAFLAQRDRAAEATVSSDLRNAAAAATSCRADTTGGVPNDYTDCNTTAILQGYDFNASAGVTLTFTGTTADRLQIQATGPESATGTFDSDTGRVVITS